MSGLPSISILIGAEVPLFVSFTWCLWKLSLPDATIRERDTPLSLLGANVEQCSTCRSALEILLAEGERLFEEARRISEKYEDAGALVSPLEDEPSQSGSPEPEQSKVIENQADTKDSGPA